MADDIITPPPLPGAVPTAGAPPTTSVSGGTNSETETVKPSPLAAAALKNVGAAANDVSIDANAGALAIPATAEAQAQGSEALANQDVESQGRLEAEQTAERNDLINARAMRDMDIDEAKNVKFHDLFHDANGDRKVGKTILTSIGLMFGGLSGNVQAMQGISQGIRDSIKNDFDKQRQEVAAKLDVAKERGENINDLENQFNREMARSKQREALAHNAVAEQMEASAIRAGVPGAQAAAKLEADKARLQANQEAATAAAAYRTTARTTRENKVIETGQKPGSVKIDAKMRDADARLTDLVNDANTAVGNNKALTPGAAGAVVRMFTDSPTIGQTLSGLLPGNSIKFPDYFSSLGPGEKEQAQAASRALGALLVDKQGNPIIDTKADPARAKEMIQAVFQQYFPISGQDTPAVMQRKASALATKLRGLSGETPRPGYWDNEIGNRFGGDYGTQRRATITVPGAP